MLRARDGTGQQGDFDLWGVWVILIEAKMARLTAMLEAQFVASARLEVAIRKNLRALAGEQNRE